LSGNISAPQQAHFILYTSGFGLIGSFIEHAVAKDSEESDKTPKDLLYNVYKRYCKENKLAVESKENFGKILKTSTSLKRAGNRQVNAEKFGGRLG
jgi:hypothetical protein